VGGSLAKTLREKACSQNCGRELARELSCDVMIKPTRIGA
jgi:hypothetical protein